MNNFQVTIRRSRWKAAVFVLACGLCAIPNAHAQAGASGKSPAVSQSGPLQVTGTLIKMFPDQSEVVMRVMSITPHSGETMTLSPPRVKILIFRDGEIPDALYPGVAFTAEGKDMGRGKPLRVGRVTIQGVDTVFAESGDGTDSSETPNGDVADSAGSPSPDPSSAPPLPDPVILDNFEHGVYEKWHLAGGRWDHAPAAVLAAASKTAKPHGVARPRVVEPPAPRAYVMLPDGTRVEGSRLMTLEATGYGPEDNGEWGDQTVLGTTVGFGTVAVDPRVIPLHKHLWVEGYGFCIALDIGGAIKGKRIDLGQDNEEDAEAVGRQKRRVLVLD